MEAPRESLIVAGARGPLVIEAASGTDLSEYVESSLRTTHEKLLDHGALLFRGFAVRNAEDFSRFVAVVRHSQMEYVYRSTPRTSVRAGIFTATEYPKDQEIPLHNENSYQRIWPLRVAFCCLVPSETGGETPIADVRRVTARLGEGIVNEFALRGVRYVRHYRPNMDLPWQTVFQTEDREALRRFCAANDICHTWLDSNTLRTEQECHGVAHHPVTREAVFFNQAHLFHISSLESDAAESLIELFGPQALPRQSYFGDGGEIPLEMLNAVREAFRQEAVMFPWRAGDVMWLDNMRFAHGRRPFTGARRVLVALMDPSGG